MITVLVEKEIDITQLLEWVLDEYNAEVTPEMREDTSLFVDKYLDNLTEDCFNQLDDIEFGINYDDSDWYHDQIREELQSSEAMEYIHDYLQD